jgi:UDPglucose 6-dehydrogenase
MEMAGTAPAVVSNPEFLREGSAVVDFLRPDRIVLGSDDPRALNVVTEVYAPILEQRVPHPIGTSRRPSLVRTDLATAETIKYAANAFLATKISFVNEIAAICEQVGADVGDVAAAMGLDSRIGPAFLDAGIGWGGSCFGKDLAALIATAEDHGYEAPLLRASVAVNQRQRRIVVEKLQRALGIIRGRRICLLGLAFKPGTDDLRDSPAVELARRLVDLGAVVSAYDPLVHRVPEVPEIRLSGNVYSAAERADASVLVTDWPEFLQLDLGRLAEVMSGRTLIDARNMLDPSWAEDAGFSYEGIGRQVFRSTALSRP